MENCIFSFVETIKFYIVENKLTPTGFARELNVKDACVARWLNGTNTPSLEYVILVANHLHCSVDYLFGLTDNPNYEASNLQSNFTKRFVALQSESTISMNQLAKLCGVTSSNVSKWAKGQLPKPHAVCSLAAHFNCSVDFLLGRSDRN